MSKTGHLKSYDNRRGYGFIVPQDEGEIAPGASYAPVDIFFHIKHAIDVHTIDRIQQAGRNGAPILLNYELDKKSIRPRAKWVQVA